MLFPCSFLMCERPILSQITQIIADKTQKHITPQPPLATNCLSLRNNAAPLHSSAWSALSAGEYSHKSTQSICTKKPQCLPQISLIYADKRQVDQMALLKQMPQISLTKTVTNYSGDIQFMLFAVCLRNNAACCIPLRDLRYLRENIHIRVLNLSVKSLKYISRRVTPRNTERKNRSARTIVNRLCLLFW